jgi:hypothetical protein
MSGKHTIDAAVLVDQINVGDCGPALDRHQLELVHDVLERTASSKGAICGDNVGVGAVGSIDDGLVVQFIHFGVEGDCCGLLEGNVVLDAGSPVQEVGHHRSISHPVSNGCSKIGGRGSLSVADARSSSSLGTFSTLLLLALLATTLLLTLLLLSRLAIAIRTLLGSEGRSIGCARKQRSDKNVLHIDNGCVEIGSTDFVELKLIRGKGVAEGK